MDKHIGARWCYGKMPVALLAAAIVLSGCTTLYRPAVSASSAPLVAQNLVSVLEQLDRLPVETTVLNLSTDAFTKDEFAIALRRSLEDAGYAIRISGFATGEQPVSFSVTKRSDATVGPVKTYTVSAGDISVRRSYAISEDGMLKPIAAMQVRGADASQVTVNDELFSRQDKVVSGDLAIEGKTLQPLVLPTNPESAKSTTDLQAKQREVLKNNFPAADTLAQRPVETEQQLATLPEPALQEALPAPDIPPRSLLDIAAPSMAKSAPVTEQFGSVERLSALPRQNVRDLGESNFASVFDDFGIVDEAILRFDNDSVRMGQGNKYRVRRFVEQFNVESDVLSVIGCSNGPTSLAIGQEGLALGRAQRVKEELLYAGVPEANILEEGCWAEDYFDNRMPRRGVVLTLKRRAPAS